MPFIEHNAPREKEDEEIIMSKKIEEYTAEELADMISEERADNADIEELVEFYRAEQFEQLIIRNSKEELEKIYLDTFGDTSVD